jgi:hypothetical protein
MGRVTGSCLCGDVAWEGEGPLVWLHHCHCGRCRKSHGTPFASFGAVPESSFRRLRGDDAIVRFESRPGFFRPFCGRCGSAVPDEAAPGLGLVFMPAGCLDGDPGSRPESHIFVASKAPWYEIPDALPRFDAYPPGVDAPVLPDPPPRPAPEPGVLRGGCLCGGVGYEVRGPIQAIRSCHCGRCRKGRAAAHASNMVVAAGALRFVRGEPLLASYKIPEARYFTQVFCRTCGGKLPRVDPERGIAVVPMGSLDDDPGRGPEHHIFTASKAPWFDIADALPQHPEL